MRQAGIRGLSGDECAIHTRRGPEIAQGIGGVTDGRTGGSPIRPTR